MQAQAVFVRASRTLVQQSVMQASRFGDRGLKMRFKLRKPFCLGQGQSHFQLHDDHGDAVVFVLRRQGHDFRIRSGEAAQCHERAVNPSK